MDKRKKRNRRFQALETGMEIPRRAAEFAENAALIQNPSASSALSLPAVAFCEGWVQERLPIVSF